MSFEIHIATKNRADELEFTLQQLLPLQKRPDVQVVVYNDGSTDDTYHVLMRFPEVKSLTNKKSKGYLYCRNYMLQQAAADFVISLDDDACFISEDPLEQIASFFSRHPSCGVIAFRIFWSTAPPSTTETATTAQKVRGFVGCGHAWRVSAWKCIPPYPEWFLFYGEETYASLCLFQLELAVYYVPSLLVQHRVNRLARKSAGDFLVRYRRSLRADWYLFFLFYPWPMAWRFLLYSLYKQIQKLPKNVRLVMPLAGALLDLIRHIPRILKERKALSSAALHAFRQLPEAPVYWNPEE